MFRVDQIIVYRDMLDVSQQVDVKLIQTILEYMETPQYLRRRLFSIVPELQYAGTLPPLRTPHHPTANRIMDLRLGEFREGMVVSVSKEDSLVDIGVEQPALLQGTTVKPNSRVTVKIIGLGKQPKVELTDRTEIKTYWGYKVSAQNISFGQLLKPSQFDLVIVTSRKGKSIASVLDDLAARWKNSNKTLVAFGAPTHGLYEIAEREHLRLEDVADFVVNIIPNQATETVRTEEAVYTTLSILNVLGQ